MTRRTVPFLDLGRLHRSIRDELRAVFEGAVEASSFVLGTPVQEFEAVFADAHGAAGAVGCGSGTDALSLAMRALGIGPGDEVIVPAMTFVATAEAVVHVGATPVIADVDPETLLLTADAAERVRTGRTGAVLPVHLYGHHVGAGALAGWSEDGLVVVEDAAQAHLASSEDRPVGMDSAAACFSFYPGKNLGALGDGGAVISAQTEVIDRVRKLRDHGRVDKYRHDEIGWCSRLDGLQAAFLTVKSRHLPAWTDARRSIADRYTDNLSGLAKIRLVPYGPGDVHHLYCVRVDPQRRDGVRAALEEQGIGVGIHYPLALTEQPSLSMFGGVCPNAEAAGRELLSLPIDPLMSLEDVDFVCEVLATVL